jgi:hypothetical protein
MFMEKKYFLIGTFVILIALGLAACQQTAPPPAEPCPECPECPEVEAPDCPEVECPECPEPEEVVSAVPFSEEWAASPHNDAEAEAFRHWDEDDPSVIPEDCAKCHSTTGYLDFLGEDGSEIGVVNSPADPGTTVECVACHNQSAEAMTSVTFPSGIMVEGLGAEAVCMQCHQGRASVVQVDEAIEEVGLTEDVDTPSEELGFVNIHYYAAAPTLYGTITKGGYEYPGKSYDFKNDHVGGYDTCIGCHSSHTLELKLEECAVCHTDVASVEDVRAIRMPGSLKDYDGDGDIEEGIASEIDGLREMLYTAIQAYGSEVAGTAVVYDSAAYPYFFIDTNENGEPDEDEAAYPNRYASWTPRLLKAAYNFQTASKDPGAYAHGGKYIIQLLYDSIEDLNQAISTPVDLSTANRLDAGHFAGSEEAFRHWDEDGEVQAACAKCHSSAGLPRFLKEGVNVSEHLANGLQCSTCHDDVSTFTLFMVDEVEFPSGAVLTFGEGDDNNLCINCHQGRQSTPGLNARIGDLAGDEVSEDLSFSNPHYFAAGATLFGTDAKGAYEFDGQSYNGRNMHVQGFETCLACHDGHALEVNAEACSACHTNVASAEDLEAIRITAGDFDGDGDEAEGISGEIETIKEALYTAIQEYAATTAGADIAFNPASYPYWFIDTNGDGEAVGDEAVRDNAFASWTPNLLRAAYNYTWVEKDPGAYAHNGLYMLQVLYDSLQAVGGDVSGFTRPSVATPEG